MTHQLPVRASGKWTFTLHLATPAQLRITSEQDASTQFTIEGHDISTLLDYLYEQREYIYDATHDQETRLSEAAEHPPIRQRRKPIIRYFYDGEVRVKEDQDTL